MKYRNAYCLLTIPILFLHNLEEIKIDIQDKESILYTKELLEEGRYNGQNGKIIIHELISVCRDDDSQKIHMFSTEVFVDKDKKRTLPISEGTEKVLTIQNTLRII